MTSALEQVYFTWLCDQVNCQYGNGAGKTYVELLGQLHSKEFIWFVPNDDNRLEDGMDLRYTFLNVNSIKDQDRWILRDLPISVLEIIIGLSKRMAFAAEGEERDWAWRLIHNLELDKMVDPLRRGQQDKIDGILEDLIWRNYDRNGVGGFFPLIDSGTDQRRVELWYQMSDYIEENVLDN